MKKRELAVARIGNSRGVRLPAETLKKYRIGSAVVMEELSDGIVLRPTGAFVQKLSWQDTAREMAASGENWNEWDSTVADGLETAEWKPTSRAVAEPRSRYGGKAQGAKRYEIRWASLDPVKGAEMAKTRPVVIVSLDELNERLQTVTVCPLTSQLHPAWRSRLRVRCGRQAAEVAVDQIRTISTSRLGGKIASLSSAEAAALRRLLTEMYGE